MLLGSTRRSRSSRVMAVLLSGDELGSASHDWSRLQEAVRKPDDGQAGQDSFNFGVSTFRRKISKLNALNKMPGWRNWQTHRT